MTETTARLCILLPGMKKILFNLLNPVILFILFPWQSCSQIKKEEKIYSESLMQDSCTFLANGKNPFFILEPGYRLTLEGIEDKDTLQLVITVLEETKTVGTTMTRVVEEKEIINGKLEEVSRNFFAFCRENGGIYYFGEEVDIYKNGKVSDHSGSWLAEGKNKAGLLMPGFILLGSRYYQEIAPGVALDRAEIIALNETVQTPAGKFANCLKTEETNALKPKEKEYKYYAPGIGLVREENLRLISYGFTR